MRSSYGTVIAIMAALFFYLRLILLQRKKAKMVSNLAKDKNKNRGLSKESGATRLNKKNNLTLIYSSPYILGLGILVIIAGAVLSASPWFIPEVKALWWIPVTIGIILMSISIH